jgi:hypothetical protein
MANGGESGDYLNDDEKLAAYLQPSFAPESSAKWVSPEAQGVAARYNTQRGQSIPGLTPIPNADPNDPTKPTPIPNADPSDRTRPTPMSLPRPQDMGGDGYKPPAEPAPPDLGDPNRPGPKLIARGAAAAARAPQPAANPASQVAPADSSDTSGSGVTPWPELVRQGTAGALRNAQSSEKTVNDLAAQPSEAAH